MSLHLESWLPIILAVATTLASHRIEILQERDFVALNEEGMKTELS